MPIEPKMNPDESAKRIVPDQIDRLVANECPPQEDEIPLATLFRRYLKGGRTALEQHFAKDREREPQLPTE